MPRELGAGGAEVLPEVTDAGGREQGIAGGMGRDVRIGVPVEPPLTRPVQAGDPQLAVGSFGSQRMDVDADPGAGQRSSRHGPSCQSIGPRCSRCGAAWATGFTDERVDVDVLGQPDGERHAGRDVVGDEGTVDALVDLVGRGLVAVQSGQRELFGVDHARTDLDDPARVRR